MNSISAEKNLQFIREMIEKTKKETATQWKFFYLWGVAIILGVIGMNTLVLIKAYKYIWVNWFATMGLAVFIQIFIIKEEIQQTEVRTFAQDAIGYISFSAGIAYTLFGFFFPLIKLYSFGAIPILISVITGILLFSIGGILNWNYLKWSGLIWFAASVIMVFINWHFRTLVFIPLIFQSYLIPAHLLRKKYKKNA